MVATASPCFESSNALGNVRVDCMVLHVDVLHREEMAKQYVAETVLALGYLHRYHH